MKHSKQKSSENSHISFNWEVSPRKQFEILPDCSGTSHDHPAAWLAHLPVSDHCTGSSLRFYHPRQLSASVRMRSPEPQIPSPSEALLHGEFGGWSTGGPGGSGAGSGGGGGGGGGNSGGNNSCPNSPGGPSSLQASSPAASYALTLTHTHIHVQRLSPRPGKESRLILPLVELAGCSCPRAPAPPLLVLYWYPPGRRRKGVSRRRQVRAYLAESRAEAEKWYAAIQCLLRGVVVSSTTGACVRVSVFLSQFLSLFLRHGGGQVCKKIKFWISLLKIQKNRY